MRFDILAADRTACGPEWSCPHGEITPCHKLYVPRRGHAWVRLDGQHCPLARGNAYWLPAGRRIAYGREGVFDVDWMHLQPTGAEAIITLSRLDRVVPLGARFASFWRPVTLRLAELGRSSCPPTLWEKVHAMLDYLAAELTEQLSPDDAPSQRDWLTRLAPALHYLDQHFLDNPPLAAVARTVHLNPVYFHRRFRAVVGVSPHAYAQSKRLALARQAMLQRGVSVKQAAAEAGYDNPFYFSRAYRRHYGHAPSHVRQRVTLQP